MRRRANLMLAGAIVAVLVAPLVRAGPAPKILEAQDGKYVHLTFEDDPKAQGWLYRPLTGDEDEEGNPKAPVDLVVALHGAGGNPKNFVMPLLMQSRGSWCLTVAGHQAVRHEQGEGFQWSGGDVKTIVALVRHVLDSYPVHEDRVIVWGHSAGGTMTLATLAEAPELFAGGLTTAAPGTPDSRHKAKRVCVFLGMEDRNWAGAGSVRAHVESLLKKKGKGACAFLAVRELGHDIPYDDYLGLGFDWILHDKARGGEAEVPRRSMGSDGEYRHILVRHKGAEGATGVKRSRSKAKKLLKGIKKELDKGRAFFPFEAACHSEDENSASCGGGLDGDDLKAWIPDLPALEPGETSDVLQGVRGLHLVMRCVPEDEDEEESD